MLTENGWIDNIKLADALNYQAENSSLIGEILVNLGYIDKKTLNEYLIKHNEFKNQGIKKAEK